MENTDTKPLKNLGDDWFKKKDYHGAIAKYNEILLVIKQQIILLVFIFIYNLLWEIKF